MTSVLITWVSLLRDQDGLSWNPVGSGFTEYFNANARGLGSGSGAGGLSGSSRGSGAVMYDLIVLAAPDLGAALNALCSC